MKSKWNWKNKKKANLLYSRYAPHPFNLWKFSSFCLSTSCESKCGWSLMILSITSTWSDLRESMSTKKKKYSPKWNSQITRSTWKTMMNFLLFDENENFFNVFFSLLCLLQWFLLITYNKSLSNSRKKFLFYRWWSVALLPKIVFPFLTSNHLLSRSQMIKTRFFFLFLQHKSHTLHKSRGLIVCLFFVCLKLKRI